MTTLIDIDALAQVISPHCISQTPDDLLRHSYDWSPLSVKWKGQKKTHLQPEVVVTPRNQEDVSRVLAWSSKHSVSVTPWGAGSSVSGAGLASRGICLDLSDMNRTLDIDSLNHTVRVETGKMGHVLESELNAHGFTLNHSPQSLDRSTVGGWVSTRASGQFSSRWGSIEDLCISVTAVLPDGGTVTTPNTPRAAVGPDIRHLFIGAEGMMGVITEARLKIFPLPELRLFECIRFANLQAGIESMRQFMQCGLRPFLVRLYDAEEAQYAMGDDTVSDPVLFVGCEGVRAVATAEMVAVVDICMKNCGEMLGPTPVKSWMEKRFDFSAVEKILNSAGGVAETIEVACFWRDVETTYQCVKKAVAPHVDKVLGHFSHAYPQGTSIYLILFGKAEDDAAAEQQILKIWDSAMQAALNCGAAISHHHGIGYVRRQFVAPYLGSAIGLLRNIKKSIDPNSTMNPGKWL